MRLRAILALGAMAAAVAGGVALGTVHPKAQQAAGPLSAFSGAWFCPHGGGPGWHVELALTNPGPAPVAVRLTSFSRGGPAPPRLAGVPARSSVRIPVDAASRGSSTEVEFFNGWLGASWVARAGGKESGIASEPCLHALGGSWFLPDGATLRGEDAWVVVMNPTAAPAVFSLRLVTEQQTILTKDWNDFVLHPDRSVAFHLNQSALGRQTVTAQIVVRIGRVAAASLDATRGGGIRASVGVANPERSVTIPSGPASGPSELVVMNAGSGRLSYTGAFDRIDGTQALPQLRQDAVPPGLARTVGFPAPPSSALQLQAARGSSFAAALRTFGPGGDQGSTTGGEPAAAWVVASGALGPKDDWRLVLANPASRPARVTLWLVSARGVARKLSPRVVVVAPRRSRLVGVDFTQGARLGAVVAVATGGSFVPLAASYTADGHGYSSALGVPIPARWIPIGMG